MLLLLLLFKLSGSQLEALICACIQLFLNQVPILCSLHDKCKTVLTLDKGSKNIVLIFFKHKLLITLQFLLCSKIL